MSQHEQTQRELLLVARPTGISRPVRHTKVLSTRWKSDFSKLANVYHAFAKLLGPDPSRFHQRVISFSFRLFRSQEGWLRRTGLHSPEFKNRELDVRAPARVKHQMQPRFVSSLSCVASFHPGARILDGRCLLLCLAYTPFCLPRVAVAMVFVR